ncbi:hypothetical protein OGR47_06380 [Methylocystis sp. MJC1]|jgi:hypothetical protein|uniref:Uncharacterized protein n=1 Tax=Methylocystis iwaonis TaxID=2885079 RepID=A0ABN6VF18_9HYPH|nr:MULTISPECIES: hypothetical protein [Methylocystis]KAF2992660.1 hypothetical protein MJC1_00238 [Methylocystis sp. MJC1]MBU6526626.1 hypothetical protein [Methylocystis sp. MJC1]MDJ0447188.1 hypothetical protein [Methylocystis sp. JR02]UZX13068.1 hypothetical protein OGR47_06380 [Methylocystis sp. MJC1]BDV33777.1 hypothetical protein SS37A_13060 [Methylocystis iwaonis]
MSEAADAPKGYFIDWDGKMRPVSEPGKGLRCEVDLKAKYVMVFNKYGGLDHESTWYPDEAAVTKAGIKVAYADVTAPIRISSID